MRFKNFFKSRTLRVIFATVCILCTLFTFVLPSFAVALPSDLPEDVYMPPQIPANFSYEYGLPKSTSSVQEVYSVFFYQRYFGGFNTHHPVAIVVIPSGDSYLTYLLCTDDERDGIFYRSDGTFFIYFTGISSGSGAGGTVFYYLLTDYGFVYDRQTSFNQQFVELDTPSNSTSVMWYLNVDTRNWLFNNMYIGTGLVEDVSPLTQLHSAYDSWQRYYYTVTTLHDRVEIYDNGYDLGFSEGEESGRIVGYREGYDEGYDGGYEEGYSEGVIVGSSSIGYFLDIPSIITSVSESVVNILGHAFDFDLFGINVVGLLLLILGCCIIFVVIKFIWGVFL